MEFCAFGEGGAGELEGPGRGGFVVEVEEVEFSGDAAEFGVGVDGGEWVDAVAGDGGEDLAEEGEFFPRFAAENAAVGEPGVLGVEVAFAVLGVGAVDVGEPDAAEHFFGFELAPSAGFGAFVVEFVEDDGFVPFVALEFGLVGFAGGGGVLEAGVGDPGFGVVVEDEAVVDGAEVVVGVGFLDDLEVAVPVGHGFGFEVVEFVGHGPPDVSVGGEAGDDVADVAVVGGGVHFVEAPLVAVGVEEDDVGFDVHVAELADAVFGVLEEGRVEAGVVPVFAWFAFEGVEFGGDGVFFVVDVLGEDVEGEFGEGGGGAGF